MNLLEEFYTHYVYNTSINFSQSMLLYFLGILFTVASLVLDFLIVILKATEV